MTWYIITLNVFELAACITGFIYWYKVKDSYWKWFPVYLGLIVLVEITGEYFLHVKQNLAINLGIYRYFGIPLQFYFFYWLFYNYFQHSKLKKWPLVAAAIYTGCLIVDILYLSKLKLLFDSFSYVIGALNLLILLLQFFFLLLKSDAILSYRRNMMFWICCGLLVFYIGSMPFHGLRTTLYREHKGIFYIYWYIQYGLNYLMYLLFMLSFIWGKPR